MAEAREHEETEWEARDIERTRSGIIGRDDTLGVMITGEAGVESSKRSPSSLVGRCRPSRQACSSPSCSRGRFLVNGLPRSTSLPSTLYRRGEPVGEDLEDESRNAKRANASVILKPPRSNTAFIDRVLYFRAISGGWGITESLSRLLKLADAFVGSGLGYSGLEQISRSSSSIATSRIASVSPHDEDLQKVVEPVVLLEGF